MSKIITNGEILFEGDIKGGTTHFYTSDLGMDRDAASKLYASKYDNPCTLVVDDQIYLGWFQQDDPDYYYISNDALYMADASLTIFTDENTTHHVVIVVNGTVTFENEEESKDYNYLEDLFINDVKGSMKGSGGGGASSWNDLKDKPFGDVIVPRNIEISPDGFMLEDGAYTYVYACKPDEVSFIPSDGTNVKVVYNGQEYLLTAMAIYDQGAYIGDDEDEFFEGEPKYGFFIDIWTEDPVIKIFIATKDCPTSPITISYDEVITHTLAEKFIPNNPFESKIFNISKFIWKYMNCPLNGITTSKEPTEIDMSKDVFLELIDAAKRGLMFFDTYVGTLVMIDAYENDYIGLSWTDISYTINSIYAPSVTASKLSMYLDKETGVVKAKYTSETRNI